VLIPLPKLLAADGEWGNPLQSHNSMPTTSSACASPASRSKLFKNITGNDGPVLNEHLRTHVGGTHLSQASANKEFEANGTIHMQECPGRTSPQKFDPEQWGAVVRRGVRIGERTVEKPPSPTSSV
jgi:hypothetical protein